MLSGSHDSVDSSDGHWCWLAVLSYGFRLPCDPCPRARPPGELRGTPRIQQRRRNRSLVEDSNRAGDCYIGTLVGTRGVSKSRLPCRPRRVKTRTRRSASRVVAARTRPPRRGEVNRYPLRSAIVRSRACVSFTGELSEEVLHKIPPRRSEASAGVGIQRVKAFARPLAQEVDIR